MAKKNFTALLGNKEAIQDKSKSLDVDLSSIKKKPAGMAKKKHSFQMDEDIYDRMKEAAMKENIAYTGRLVHLILKKWLDDNHY